RLAALGVRAKFVQVMPGCQAGLPPAAVAHLKAPGAVLLHASRATRIDPRTIPRGRMIVIVSWAKARRVHIAKLGAAITAGAPTGNSGTVTAKPTMPPPPSLAKGCPKPQEVRPGSPGTGSSGTTGNSG